MKFATLMMVGAVGASTTNTIKVTKAYCLDSANEYDIDGGYDKLVSGNYSDPSLSTSQLKKDYQTLEACYKKHDANKMNEGWNQVM